VGTAGQIALTRAFAEGPPSRVSLVGMTQILFGVLADLAVWGRAYDAWTLLGMGLVAAPTAWILLRGGLGVKGRPPAGATAADEGESDFL